VIVVVGSMYTHGLSREHRHVDSVTASRVNRYEGRSIMTEVHTNLHDNLRLRSDTRRRQPTLFSPTNSSVTVENRTHVDITFYHSEWTSEITF
jgi:hypothetical protein